MPLAVLLYQWKLTYPNNRFNVDLEIYGSEAFISKSTSSEINNQKEALNKFIDEIISEGGLELLNENN